MKDILFFGPFFDLPTYPYPIFSHLKDCFSLAISNFHKPTYLPKNRISFLNAPLTKQILNQNYRYFLPEANYLAFLLFFILGGILSQKLPIFAQYKVIAWKWDCLAAHTSHFSCGVSVGSAEFQRDHIWKLMSLAEKIKPMPAKLLIIWPWAEIKNSFE